MVRVGGVKEALGSRGICAVIGEVAAMGDDGAGPDVAGILPDLDGKATLGAGRGEVF